MTMPDPPQPVVSPAPLPAPLDVPPLPVQSLSYASGDTASVASSGVRVLLGFLAAFHFLLGVPIVLGPLMSGVSAAVGGGYVDPGSIVAGAMGLVIGGIDIACGVWMLVRRPWTWRAAHVCLTVLSVLELLVFVGGAAMIVSYKHAQGWDGIALAFGIIFAIFGTLLFWLHAVSKLLMLRRNVRRAFFLGDFDHIALHRGATFVLMGLYGLVLFVGLVWFVLR